MALIQTIIPGFESISKLLDNQATQLIQLNDKITDIINMIIGVLLSGANTALALTYGVTIFAIYLMAKVTTGALLSFGPIMFLSLLSDKAKGWFVQLISFQMVFLLIVAYLAIFGNLLDNNLETLKTSDKAYRMTELAPVWGLILIMVIGAKH